MPLTLDDVPDDVPLIRKDEGEDDDDDDEACAAVERSHRRSLFRGVSWRRGAWESRIRLDDDGDERYHRLGRFDDELDAARAYAKAAWKYASSSSSASRDDDDDDESSVPEIHGGLDLRRVPRDLPLAYSDYCTGPKKKFKGVSQQRRGGGWQARVHVDGVRRPLGTFRTAEEAALIVARATYYLRHLVKEKEGETPAHPDRCVRKTKTNKKPQHRRRGGAPQASDDSTTRTTLPSDDDDDDTLPSRAPDDNLTMKPSAAVSKKASNKAPNKKGSRKRRRLSSIVNQKTVHPKGAEEVALTRSHVHFEQEDDASESMCKKAQQSAESRPDGNESAWDGVWTMVVPWFDDDTVDLCSE